MRSSKSTPSTAFYPDSPASSSLSTPNQHQIAAFLENIRVSREEIALVRGKNSEVREEIEGKRRKLRELKELHAANVEMVVKNEKELDDLRRKRPKEAQNSIKKDLKSRVKQQFDQFEALIQANSQEMQAMSSITLPETHPNRLISLLLAQIQLYQGQIQQQQRNFERICGNFSSKTRSILSDSADLASDLKSTQSARPIDLQKGPKLTRTENYNAAVLRNSGKRPLDEVARSAGEEIVRELSRKVQGMEGNAVFLSTLEEKLKRKGLNLAFQVQI